jgi:hypothetical protein
MEVACLLRAADFPDAAAADEALAALTAVAQVRAVGPITHLDLSAQSPV